MTPPRNLAGEEELSEICCGNEAAMQFARVFLHWCHWIDDVIDKDRLWVPDRVIRINLDMMTVFSENEFFRRNLHTVCPLILQASRAFGDSVKWEKRKGRRDRRAADVLKGFYHEVFWHVAYLTAAQSGKDGWAHMSAVTEKYRSYSYDYKG